MTAVRSFGAVPRSLTILSGLAVILAALLSSPVHAQSGPPTVTVNVDGPIEVAEPVAVEFDQPVAVTGTVGVSSNRTPVQVAGSDFCNVPGQCQVIMLVVPEGQRLVIEHIALRTTFSPAAPGTNAAVRVNTQFGDAFQSIALGATTNTGPGLNTVDVFNSVVKLYSQSGSTVRCVVLAPSFQTFLDMNCTLTGYLEPE